MTSIHYSSNSVEHCTPKVLVNLIDSFFDGVIGLDPCSNLGIPNIPALRHFNFVNDGLLLPWLSIRNNPTTVFMNPPYGRGVINRWVDKLCAEYLSGNVSEAIALVPARTSTKWWDKFEQLQCPTCFIDGRLTFIGNTDCAPFPSALCYFGNRAERFSEYFESEGTIWQVVKKTKSIQQKLEICSGSILNGSEASLNGAITNRDKILHD